VILLAVLRFLGFSCWRMPIWFLIGKKHFQYYKKLDEESPFGLKLHALVCFVITILVFFLDGVWSFQMGKQILKWIRQRNAALLRINKH